MIFVLVAGISIGIGIGTVLGLIWGEANAKRLEAIRNSAETLRAYREKLRRGDL